MATDNTNTWPFPGKRSDVKNLGKTVLQIERDEIRKRVLDKNMEMPNSVGLTVCTVPPPGWRCTRPAGHPGSCAAWPINEQTPLSADECAIAVESDAVAFELHIGETPNRIITDKTPWGWRYRRAAVQDEFMTFRTVQSTKRKEHDPNGCASWLHALADEIERGEHVGITGVSVAMHLPGTGWKMDTK